jgi:flagellar hook-associated protein 1 FlgK
VASSVIWEVNRIHSQGTGNTLLDYSQGQQQVESSTQALGSAQSILPNADRLQSGNVNFYFYDKTTGEYVTSGMLDFDSSTAEVENFDPSVHSLEDVANAINSSFPDPNNAGQNLLKASIQDGRLLIETNSASNVQFALGADTSGLMAALGVNAFFTGTGADDLAVNSQMHSDVNYIAAGQVNGQYQVNAGDNATATAIAKLADTTVTISTVWKTVSNQTISQYYANLVTTVGADTRSVQTNAEYHTALTSDLEDQVSSVTGVNLDEEMANLIKYQHSYTAAAKLITTADQMLQTLLGLKE